VYEITATVYEMETDVGTTVVYVTTSLTNVDSVGLQTYVVSATVMVSYYVGT
jgi:hypothetical protein